MVIKSLSRWWDSRTKHTHGTVVMAASETSFLWGMVRFYRYRAYVANDIDSVTIDTSFRTWRSLNVGPFVFAFRLPKFIEDNCD